MPNIDPRDPLAGNDAIRTALKASAGAVHMLGIGGVGMAGLALLLKKKGWAVSGCDAYPGILLPWLQSQGITCSVGHDAAHLDARPDFLVRSPAVSREDPELQAARRSDIPVIDRGCLLPALLTPYRTVAVAGTHGKTTTASMIAWILKHAGETTSYCIGGICPCLGAVAQVEQTGYMVVEADESDGTLRYYSPETAVITSMDMDHVDYFQNEEMLMRTYQDFAFAAAHAVYPAADRLATLLLANHPDAVSIGVECQADVSAVNITMSAGKSVFDVQMNGEMLGQFEVGVPGRHNILNALSAMAVTHRLGIDPTRIASALKLFKLPLRRFEKVAEGGGKTVISDYAHHPVEIAALLAQARLIGARRMIAVFQPHRYSRTKAFLREFVDVLSGLDYLVLAPVYSASEPFIEGGTSEDLFRGFDRSRVEQRELATSVEDAWQKLQTNWQEGDLLLIIGAGDVDVIGKWAAAKLARTNGK